MKSKITFKKDENIVVSNIKSVVDQMEMFHRFILINSQTVINKSNRFFDKRCNKVIMNGNDDKFIIHIAITKKINEKTEILYIMKSSNDEKVVSFDQFYDSYNEIYEDLGHVIEKFKELYEK